mgnify:FL=1
MAIGGFALFGGILMLITFGIIIFYIVKNAGKEEEYVNYPIVELEFLKKYTHGSVRGELREIIPGKYRDGFVFMPKDKNFLKRLRNKVGIEIKPEIYFAYPHQVSFYSEGILSNERTIIKILPPNPENIPSSVLKTPFGQGLAIAISQNKAEKTSVDVMRMERDTEDDMLKETKGRDLFRKYLNDSKRNKHRIIID